MDPTGDLLTPGLGGEAPLVGLLVELCRLDCAHFAQRVNALHRLYRACFTQKLRHALATECDTVGQFLRSDLSGGRTPPPGAEARWLYACTVHHALYSLKSQHRDLTRSGSSTTSSADHPIHKHNARSAIPPRRLRCPEARGETYYLLRLEYGDDRVARRSISMWCAH